MGTDRYQKEIDKIKYNLKDFDEKLILYQDPMSKSILVSIKNLLITNINALQLKRLTTSSVSRLSLLTLNNGTIQKNKSIGNNNKLVLKNNPKLIEFLRLAAANPEKLDQILDKAKNYPIIGEIQESQIYLF